MLQIVVPAREYWNETVGEFIYTKEQTLCLEHSLVSLSKWEEKWKKPFPLLRDRKITEAEMRYYIQCMTLTQNVDPNVYLSLSEENYKAIYEYIDDPMTATTFLNDGKASSRQIITSELIYYWMIALNIPFECKKWHLNRLLTLIRVCNIENSPKKKKSQATIMNENKQINEMRSNQLNTKG